MKNRCNTRGFYTSTVRARLDTDHDCRFYCGSSTELLPALPANPRFLMQNQNVVVMMLFQYQNYDSPKFTLRLCRTCATLRYLACPCLCDLCYALLRMRRTMIRIRISVARAAAMIQGITPYPEAPPPAPGASGTRLDWSL